MSRHSFDVATGREAPSAVRDALRELGSHLPTAMRDDLLLLITEVVTNAVRHSGAVQGDPIAIDLREQRDCVRVEVTDPGHGFRVKAITTGSQDGLGGWGLWMVDELSDRWGVDFRHSTRVWCEFDRA
jgi:signal transduction histidine kinase